MNLYFRFISEKLNSLFRENVVFKNIEVFVITSYHCTIIWFMKMIKIIRIDSHLSKTDGRVFGL